MPFIIGDERSFEIFYIPVIINFMFFIGIVDSFDISRISIIMDIYYSKSSFVEFVKKMI